MPQVSVGLPVYNGENYVAEAITSVLEQDYHDLELVICDNASTDRTGDICRDFAERDGRVRYWRNERNVGAARNYDLAWERSSGRYFKWLAHDDRVLPGYVSATVAALEQNPEAVLCNTIVDYIGATGEHLGYYRSVIRDCGGPDPAARFAPIVLRMHTCVDFFGMIRRSALEGSLLHQPFRGSDRTLVAQLALRGRLLQLPTPMVQMRQHPAQYSQMKNVHKQQTWQDPARRKGHEIAIRRLYRTYMNLIETERLDMAQRAACRAVMRRFWLQSWTGPRLLAELLSVPFPGRSSVFRSVAIKIGMSGAPQDYMRP